MTRIKKAVKKAQDGTYFAFRNGRVGRTRPILGSIVEYESMDTSGYSKGKKKFDVTTNTPSKKSSKSISREQVPSKISEMKRGATRIEDYKNPKKAQGGKIKPKASNVSKKLGSAKKSIGNMRFAKKKK